MEAMSNRVPPAFENKSRFNTKRASRSRNILSDLNYKHEAIRLAQSQKIALCNHFTKAFNGTDFFNKSFRLYNNLGSGYNYAMGALLDYAVTGTYPDVNLVYENVLISKGKLKPAQYAAAATMRNGNIYFSFTDNSDSNTAFDTDKIILVAYAEKLQQSVFTFDAGMRKNCEAVLKTAALKGCVVETWMGFLSADEANASDSVYTGRLQL